MAEKNTDNSIVSPIQMTDIGKDMTHVPKMLLEEIVEVTNCTSAIVVTAVIGEPVVIHINTYKLTNPRIVLSIITALQQWVDDNPKPNPPQQI